MKKLLNSGIFQIFLILAIAGFILACEKDDDPPDPSGTLPNLEFTYSPMDIRTGLEIDDYEAPTHIVIDFPVGYDELGTWEKVEIDYGNGVIHKYEPFNPRQGMNPVIYYSPGAYQITVRVYNSLGMKEMSKKIEILAMKTFKYQYLSGIWSIINEKVSPGAGHTIEKPRKKYHKMFEFAASEPQYFNYSRRDMHWLEEEYGTFTIDGFNIQTLPENGNDYPLLTLTVDSFYRNSGEVHLAMHTTMPDDDIGETRYDADLIFIDHSDPWYHFDQSLDDHKWNVIEEETKIYAYSDLTMEFSDLIETIPKETIPHNLLTVDLRDGPINMRIIDNWNDGGYERIDNYYRYRMFYRLRIGEWDSIQLVFVLFDPEFQSSDPNIYSLTTATFIEENGERFRVETKNKMRLSNGTEARIDRDSLIGSWEIIDKTETIDGIEVSPGNSETPPIGAIFEFNADGSANLGGGSGESWLMLDDCNFVFVTSGADELLIHLNAYNEDAAQIEIMSITHESEDNYKNIYQLSKQY